MSVYRPPPIRVNMPRPMVIASPRAAARPKRRKSGGGGMLGGASTFIAIGVAAAVIGMAEKAGIMDKLPDIPLVGRKGALAIGAYYYSKHGGGSLARDVALAAAVLSGYQLAKEGTITGDD
jgi:hypothetical protein